MADAPKPNPPAEDDMHWGITYLREDIQDLRSAVRAMHDRMDTLTQSVLACASVAHRSNVAAMHSLLVAMGRSMSRSIGQFVCWSCVRRASSQPSME